jgi:hypothetical protein
MGDLDRAVEAVLPKTSSLVLATAYFMLRVNRGSFYRGFAAAEPRP